MKTASQRLLGCLLFVLLAGCSSSPTTDYGLVSLLGVSGSVTLDGQPLADAEVKFEAESGQYSVGKTDSAGRFTLQFDSIKSGCTEGKKIVRITTRPVTEGGGTPEMDEGTRNSTAVSAERIPPRYNQKSELTAEVTPQKTSFEFTLKSK